MSKTVCQSNLPFHPDRKVTLRFDGGRISSDAGWAPLYLVDRSQRLSQGLTQCIRDERDARYVQHSVATMARQRMLQIAAGYEGTGEAMAGGGSYILYDIRSQHLGALNSEALINIQWRHMIGNEGDCIH